MTSPVGGSVRERHTRQTLAEREARDQDVPAVGGPPGLPTSLESGARPSKECRAGDGGALPGQGKSAPRREGYLARHRVAEGSISMGVISQNDAKKPVTRRICYEPKQNLTRILLPRFRDA